MGFGRVRSGVVIFDVSALVGDPITAFLGYWKKNTGIGIKVLVILCAGPNGVVIGLLGAVGFLHQSHNIAILVLRIFSLIGRLILALAFHILPIMPIICRAPIGRLYQIPIFMFFSVSLHLAIQLHAQNLPRNIIPVISTTILVNKAPIFMTLLLLLADPVCINMHA